MLARRNRIFLCTQRPKICEFTWGGLVGANWGPPLSCGGMGITSSTQRCWSVFCAFPFRTTFKYISNRIQPEGLLQSTPESQHRRGTPELMSGTDICSLMNLKKNKTNYPFQRLINQLSRDESRNDDTGLSTRGEHPTFTKNRPDQSGKHWWFWSRSSHGGSQTVCQWRSPLQFAQVCAPVISFSVKDSDTQNVYHDTDNDGN